MSAVETDQRPRGRRIARVVVALAFVVSACSGDEPDEPAQVPYAGYSSEVYEDEAAWICRPDLEGDVCRDLSTTRIETTGKRSVQNQSATVDAPIDCFYVYPTVSTDEGINSDRWVEPDDNEVLTVEAQAAPYGRSCRVFAPIYRQGTGEALVNGRMDESRAVAYADVLDAWKTYVTQFSDGRGVVVVGHSQGATLLKQLLAEEVDPEPALRERLIAAHLVGASVLVPEGELDGSSFFDIPGCTAADQIGCVVTFSSYRADSPPPENAFFGRAAGNGTRALCTDVVELLGRDHSTAIERTASKRTSATGESLPALDDIDTRYVAWPEAVDVSCVATDRFDYLAVELADADDERRVGELLDQTVGPNWGLHTVEMKLLLDDMVELASRQGAAYVG